MLFPMSRNGRLLGLILGPFLFLLTLYGIPFETLPNEAQAVLASTLWIATWWVTEAVPIPVASLLPIILFPMTGAMNSQIVASAYGDDTIFLFMGGFMIGLALEKWGLHRRLALIILNLVGTRTETIILGFMLTSGFLSMWISNTAATMMMLPIGIAIITKVQSLSGKENISALNLSYFSKSLLLGIAYGASIGGIGTLIGTPPNIILAAMVKEIYGFEISFAQWMKFGIPISIAMLAITWFLLTKVIFPIKMKNIPFGHEVICKEKACLGKMAFEEKATLLVFMFAAIGWISRTYWAVYIPGMNDTTISLIAGLILFITPSMNKKGDHLLDWQEVMKLPWGVLLLFGGGLAIAKGFMESGLAKWLIANLHFLHGMHFILIIFILIVVVKILTEITSNTATAAMLYPIMASLSLAIDVHPLSLMIATGLSAALAFMLPVSTPPNAIVFSSNRLRIIDMVKAGFWINIVSVILILLSVYFLLPSVWDINIFQFPVQWK